MGPTPVCVDHKGEPRCYGEQWSVSECESCCCVAAGVVECSKQVCEVRECNTGEYQVGTYDIDACCTAPCCALIPPPKCPECPPTSIPTVNAMKTSRAKLSMPTAA